MHVDCYHVKCLTQLNAQSAHVHYPILCMNADFYLCIRTLVIFDKEL